MESSFNKATIFFEFTKILSLKRRPQFLAQTVTEVYTFYYFVFLIVYIRLIPVIRITTTASKSPLLDTLPQKVVFVFFCFWVYITYYSHPISIIIIFDSTYFVLFYYKDFILYCVVFIFYCTHLKQKYKRNTRKCHV